MAEPHAPFGRRPRVVAGIMSGTSADGVDVAIARVDGTGREIGLEVMGFVHAPYDHVLRDLLIRNAEAATSSVRELALLDALLAHRFAEAVSAACETASIGTQELDLIGSHGHTFHHIPDPQAIAGRWVAATLQLGDGPTLAALTGVPVVSGFRTADVALGGQGAPLVPYFDWALFGDDGEARVLLNLGGIANLTLVPAGADRGDVVAFDAGPANMVIDALARRLLGLAYDANGEAAASGTPDRELLDHLLEDAYFAWPPPKSTGRERFGDALVENLVASGHAPADLLATATALSVQSVADAIERFLVPIATPEVLIVSGGGVHNATLMHQLGEAVAPLPVRTTADYGLDPDAKECLCFVVLAHEFLNGVPTSLPAVTGAQRGALLGQLALP